jgi:hypothetical protein
MRGMGGGDLLSGFDLGRHRSRGHAPVA